MDRNRQATGYLALLQHLESGPELAFRSRLRSVGFDYSLASLERLDGLLAALRDEVGVGYGAFLAQQGGSNFVAALNFYLGTTIAQAGPFGLKWVDYDEARQFMPALPRRMETELGCVIADALYFPGNVVTERLFDPQPERTCRAFAQEVLARGTAEGKRLPGALARPTGQPRPSTLPPLWQQALQEAGALAAWGLSKLAAGAAAFPAMAAAASEGRSQRVDLNASGHASAREAAADGMARLEHNPQGAPWLALYYDGFTYLPTGQQDALVVELRVYEAAPPAANGLPGSLRLTLALPYRPQDGGRAFAVHAPRPVHCSWQGPELPLVLETFYRGILSAGHVAWDAHFAEGPAPPLRK